jgi:hypothetical protein
VDAFESDSYIESLPPAMEIGRICGMAGQAQRDLGEWAERYPGVFSGGPYDPALFNMLCLCTTFAAPWLASTDLRLGNRAALWGFASDWAIDYVAKTRTEVTDVVDRCLAVAEGARPDRDDDLTRSLADIRDDLAKTPAFPAMRHLWDEDLGRYLQGMAREWDWKAARAAGRTEHPTFAEYLGNTDNFGFSFPFVTHWISNSEFSPPPAEVKEIQAASWEAQRIMRLINDLGTYERDLSWGDLNGLMLGVTKEKMGEHIARLTGQFREIVKPLRTSHPRLIYYIERQMEFCAGFYKVADYWGAI